MAHRIQMKLGVVPDAEHAPDSPDTALHVEPRVGAQTRTKGHLFLLVTSRVPGVRARDATRLIADSIRSEYYYDESAGIRVCLVKAIQVANKRLTHARERGALGNGPGPIGVALAVVRDNELYVCTVGPAEAYLSRGARLSTLPDPHRDRGLPSLDIEPDVWRGEINVGDQLMLVSPNVVAALGAESLKDALVTLHPQSAAEQLTARFRADGGTGSDGIVIIEAAEIAVSRAGVVPVPVRPAEPLAGMPDRSPIPLADTVAGGFAAAQSSARWARGAVGRSLYRLLVRVQDALPSRGVRRRRVTPLSARRETQRRAAVALLSLVVVVGGLGAAVFVLGGRSPLGNAIETLNSAQGSLDLARRDINRVIGPGIDLVANDPPQATRLLNEALTAIEAASRGGIPSATTGPIRAQIVAAIDRLYRMNDVVSEPVFGFSANAAADLGTIVRGPDGAPFVLDHKTQAVYRIDLAAKRASAVFRQGSSAAGRKEGAPKLLAVGGRDLLIVDDKNVVWRWRPANSSGRGTLTRFPSGVAGSAEWGNDIIAVGTFIRDADANLYNLYVLDPSEQQILAYAPAADGSGYPTSPNDRLSAPRDLSHVTDMYIDGDIWIVDGGQIKRIFNLKIDDWEAASPGDDVLRGEPSYRLMASATARREGTVYAYDPTNQRVVAVSKLNGTFQQQYRLAGGDAGWQDLRGWYVEQGVAGEPDALVWISKDAIHRVVLEATTAAPQGSGAPASAGASPGASR
ncbi:MAG TPA: hypothetical protein VL749_11860 [Patescibacteria group bacterium]|nr:hypothetical protein [Patescibacteria group bacterium]